MGVEPTSTGFAVRPMTTLAPRLSGWQRSRTPNALHVATVFKTVRRTNPAVPSRRFTQARWYFDTIGAEAPRDRTLFGYQSSQPNSSRARPTASSNVGTPYFSRIEVR